MTNTAIQPFQIDIPQADVDDLHRRLETARWPDELPDVGWEFGVAKGYLKDLADHWRTGYDWRAHEARLNALPQFTTEIDGQTIHFVHMRSPDPDAVPLLITHGWPSTFADFADLIGPLADPHGAGDAPAFHVIVPSVPGFAFSGPTRERGWGTTARVARAWAELMERLGYDRYVVQGGDFGSLVAPEVARVDPERVIGVHVNALVSAATLDWTSEDPTAGLPEEAIAQAYAANASWEERSGYATIQATRPQTLAYALTDSPLGLLAWNLEWFVDYDPARTVQVPVDRDAIPDQRRHPLAHEHGQLSVPDLQGERRRLLRGRADRPPHRRLRVPGRLDHPGGGGAIPHDRQVDQVRARRSLRLPPGAGPPDRRHPRLLQGARGNQRVMVGDHPRPG